MPDGADAIGAGARSKRKRAPFMGRGKVKHRHTYHQKERKRREAAKPSPLPKPPTRERRTVATMPQAEHAALKAAQQAAPRGYTIKFKGTGPRDRYFAHFHGAIDPTVRIEWARESATKLRALGVHEYELKEYADLEHGANLEEVNDVEAWLRRTLPAA